MRVSKVLIVLAAFLLGIAGMQPAAWAMLTGIADGGSRMTAVVPVGIYLYDPNGFDQAAPNDDTNPFRMRTCLSALEYSADSIVFRASDTPVSIDSGISDSSQIFSRMVPDDWHQIDPAYADDVTYREYDLINSPAACDDPFRIPFDLWVSVEPTFIAIGPTEDMVKSSTPVPASALMLITGLVGLIGFRRRMMNH